THIFLVSCHELDLLLPEHGWTRSTELDPIVGSKFEDIPNGNCRWLRWSNCVVRRRNRCRSEKLFEPGRREHDKVVIRNVAGITELVRDIAGGYESFTSPQSEDLLCDDGFQFAGEHKQRFILERMCMTRHAFPRRDS